MSLTHIQQRDVLTAHLSNLQASGFYGQVTLHIQGGNILRVVEQKTTKLEEVSDGNAGEEARSSGLSDQEASALEEQAHQEGEDPKAAHSHASQGKAGS